MCTNTYTFPEGKSGKLTSVFAATNDILRHKQWKHSSLGNCILKIFPYYHVISTQKKHELKRSASTCTMYKCAIHTNVIKYDKCDYVQKYPESI